MECSFMSAHTYWSGQGKCYSQTLPEGVYGFNIILHMWPLPKFYILNLSDGLPVVYIIYIIISDRNDIFYWIYDMYNNLHDMHIITFQSMNVEIVSFNWNHVNRVNHNVPTTSEFTTQLQTLDIFVIHNGHCYSSPITIGQSLHVRIAWHQDIIYYIQCNNGSHCYNRLWLNY